MPSDGTATRQAILASAQEHFISHGFAAAHLRHIAAGAGLTTGALYRHFKDKDALFAAIAQPLWGELIAKHKRQSESYIERLDSEGMAPMWEMSSANARQLLLFIYDHLPQFQLLLRENNQPQYRQSSQTLVEQEVRSSLRYLHQAKRYGFMVQIPAEQELDLLAHAQLAAIFKLALDDIPRANALEYTNTLGRFFAAGWKSLILG